MAKKTKKNLPDSQEVFLSTLSALQDFCADNVLALKPLLEDENEDSIVQDRIVNFVTISNILESVEQMISAQNKKEKAEKPAKSKKK